MFAEIRSCMENSPCREWLVSRSVLVRKKVGYRGYCGDATTIPHHLMPPWLLVIQNLEGAPRGLAIGFRDLVVSSGWNARFK